MPLPSTMTPIATTTVTGSPTSVSFASISSAYTDLVVVINVGESSAQGITIKINNDTGTNYSNTRLVGNGSDASSNRRDSTASVYLDDGITFSSAAGNNNSILHFMNYANTTTYKTWLQRSNNAANGTAAVVGLWRSTAAINRLDFSISGATLVAGSTFTIYGVKAAS
jgi:hypothetical protein